ncbi:MAG TPA: hypothetical protein VNR59_12535, partial [Gaiellaceae bacterium]|nr:hypothetical protein [Gaiellaceae bacterium]
RSARARPRLRRDGAHPARARARAEGVAARVLLELGADADLVRERSVDFLEGRASPSKGRQERQRQREALPPRTSSPATISVMSRGVPSERPFSTVGGMVTGALVFLIALAIGLLLGYLIWH